MTQLRLAYSSVTKNSVSKTNDSGLPSKKLRMSRATSSRLPRLASKSIQLLMKDPAAAIVIEKLVDDALRRLAG